VCDLDQGSCERFCGIECGDECGNCPVDPQGGLYCTQSGLCSCDDPCVPDCTDKACGDDRCGGSCGSCGSDEICGYTPLAPTTQWTCEPFAGTDPAMSFFVTSRGSGPSWGKLGGLAGADARCTQHAAEVGVFGKTWHAYLSTGTVAARDRIGTGPWFNAKGQSIVPCTDNCIAALHSTGIPPELIVTERGALLDWRNKHDVLTGSLPDGTASGFDCADWTSNEATVEATVGHLDGDAFSWGSTHERGCDVLSMRCRGAGNIYCFAL
ncbi:MAG: hypothetical protein JRI68_33375, partial [Deltaproteobacteria bacterium]|nr:hypothetical protein [Deltaproteobacteria bacterium]